MVKDIICGMDVEEGKAVKEEYEGKTYFFCSKNCLDSFRENPGKFVKQE